MIEIFVTTQNKGKQREIKEILNMLAHEIGKVVIPLFPEEKETVPETGKSYVENALMKACWWAKNKELKIPILAEDSGLEIFALNKFPGVNSSIIPSENSTDKERCLYILERMKNLNRRECRYISCALLYLPAWNIWFYDFGETYGTISYEMIGENGFGYDPIFLSAELRKTFGSVTVEEKISVSHRKRAIWKLKNLIANLEP